MSAVVGIFNRDGSPVEERILRGMLDASASYGPDGQNLLIAGNVGFGQLMLHITPESVGERLPLQQGELLITADARIDNRAELAAHGVSAAAAPDSQLILQAYRAWGEGCPQRLIGDFSFAIWNEREGTLFIAGDHIGARPLYYYATPRLLLFATDVRALLAHPATPDEPDERVVAAYIAQLGFNPARETFYKGIVKLPAGHTLHVDRATCREARYWFPFDLPPLRLKAEAQYVDMLRELLATAVACRVRTDFPVASHISGGLDSTGVAALAARQLGQQGRRLAAGYSWAPSPQVVPLEQDDNRRLIEMAGQQWDIPLHYVSPTAEDFLSYVQRLPNVGSAPNYAAEVRVVSHAATQKARVVLSGWGGNEGITAGSGSLAGLLARGRVIRVGQEFLRQRSRRATGMRSFFKQNLASCLPDALYYRLLPDKFAQAETFLAPALGGRSQDVAGAHASRMLAGVRRNQREGVERLPRVPAVWTGLGAPYGVVYAFPWLDRRVLEFSYRIPEELFYRQGRTRYIYRAAMSGILPDDIIWPHEQLRDLQMESRYPWWHGAWSLLARQVRAGEWDHDVPWLDMPRLRRAILAVPAVEALRGNWHQFMALAQAAEMRYLYHFFHDGSSQTTP